MRRPIDSVETARRVRFGPTYDPHPYREGGCCEQIYSGFRPYQCTRAFGHGPGGMYCKQHAKQFKQEVSNETR